MKPTPRTVLSVSLAHKDCAGEETERRVFIYLPDRAVSREDLAELMYSMGKIVDQARTMLDAVNTLAPPDQFGMRKELSDGATPE